MHAVFKNITEERVSTRKEELRKRHGLSPKFPLFLAMSTRSLGSLSSSQRRYSSASLLHLKPLVPAPYVFFVPGV
ncbi:hypothetical protein Nepgr_001128 [Nepenthes gracilis]|uniref:Uncharacterized protein n=1 Tax=Nepenthes gracilis TaxID=150966 RepID=A0AAD3P7P6_NEPGR|nr:hypothetical protein Nepgr_001128 [Nepenthes gracilis]